MKLETVGEFLIWESDGHGKAVKGTKKTSEIQVRQIMSGGYLVLNSFRFPVGDNDKRKCAIDKAKEYAKSFIE